LPPASNLPSPGRLLPDSKLPTPPEVAATPAASAQPSSSLPPDSNLHPGSDLLAAPEVLGTLPDSDLPPDSNLPPGGNLLPGGEYRTSNGRLVRIRVARSVQDAHTSGEHLLLQIMWKRAIAETEDSRLLKAGLSELARWTGAHKTSCRDYVRALIHKLAIEEAAMFRAEAGRDGSTVYRVFSFKAILERRRQAGLTHVIRTGAVSFVDPRSGEKVPAGGKLLPGSNLPPDSTLLPPSNLLPGSNFLAAPGSSQPPAPGSNLRGINNKQSQEAATSSKTPIPALLADSILRELGFVDDDALRKLVDRCREVAPDASDEEIAELAALQARRIRRMSGVENPVALLLTQTPKCFAGQSFALYRKDRSDRQRRLAELYGQDLA